MFRGNHPTRVDEKGRLKVPAEFKRVIDEKYGQQFYITSLDGKVAQVYPFEEWERIEQKLASLSTFNPTKKKFLDRVNYYGQVVEMDGQGRLLIPQILRDAAPIKIQRRWKLRRESSVVSRRSGKSQLLVVGRWSLAKTSNLTGQRSSSDMDRLPTWRTTNDERLTTK